MPKFVKNIQIDDVHRVNRPGIGPVYTGRITVEDLATALEEGDIKYAPKYQRGMTQSDDNDFDEMTLVPINSVNLKIETKRAEAMAAKYLMAVAGEGDRMLFNPDVIWNARRDSSHPDPDYDPKKKTLVLHSTITIPDSAHRHYCYYLLNQWKEDPERVPDEIVVSEDGEAVDNGDLVKWLEKFDPSSEEESSILVQIFNVPPEFEGKLFDEYNVEGKQPSKAASIDMYSDKTASRRFVTGLMKTCPIFDRSEIETRANTIAAASRKITTVSTLDVAIKPFSKKLMQLEKNKAVYKDLIEFFGSFYEEWAAHYPAFKPTASGKLRQDLRKVSFAMSNIMFFPMFRLAFALWEKYSKNGTDWRSEQEWRDGLARLAGEVKVNGKTVPVMARDSDDPFQEGNPKWHELIMVPKFDNKGNHQGHSLSSTRQTRDAAYHYLVKVAGVEL